MDFPAGFKLGLPASARFRFGFGAHWFMRCVIAGANQSRLIAVGDDLKIVGYLLQLFNQII